MHRGRRPSLGQTVQLGGLNTWPSPPSPSSSGPKNLCPPRPLSFVRHVFEHLRKMSLGYHGVPAPGVSWMGSLSRPTLFEFSTHWLLNRDQFLPRCLDAQTPHPSCGVRGFWPYPDGLLSACGPASVSIPIFFGTWRESDQQSRSQALRSRRPRALEKAEFGVSGVNSTTHAQRHRPTLGR